jgi:hypothetical protein
LTLDEYNVRARVVPALITALPLTLLVTAFVSAGLEWLYPLLTEAGAAMLLASMVRHQGRRKQQKLFDSWGGRPSDRLLRHAGATNIPALLRRHEQLSRLMNIQLPTADDEGRDPKGAAAVYETCVDTLRARTRERSRFPLVFEENCNYGFARNLWALRGVGFALALFGTVTLGGRLLGFLLTHQRITMPLVVLTTLNAALLLVWTFNTTTEWVKGPADAYGRALLETLDVLS